jgi:tripartite-type tricarboxylate transporter receptor subunit TctC
MLVRLVTLVTFSLVCINSAQAQYPNRPIRLIVPAAPGGGTDITTRGFAPAFQDALGQSVVVENRGGAGGVVGSAEVARAAPDGYTLMMVYISHATNPTLVEKLPYDTIRDFTAITLVSHEPVVLVTHPSVPANTLKEFTAWAKPQGDKLSYATDPGSAGFLGAELYKQLAGVKAAYIPYKGSGPAAADVLAGHVPYMWSVISIITPHVKSGRMKGLAIAAEKRAPSLPDVPTTAEAGMPNFAVSGWYGLVGPAKLPKEVVDKVNAAAIKALKDEKVIERLATGGSQPIGQGPAEFGAHIKREIERWNKVLKTAGIQLNK